MRGIAAATAMAVLAAGTALAQPPPTEVEALESLRTMVPAPKVGEGAPYYSSEQLDAERKQANRNIGCIGNAARRSGFGTIGGGLRGFGGGSLGGYRYSQRVAVRGFTQQAEESRISSHARKAMNATLAAEDARKKAAQGLVGAAEVERTELLRQSAVRYYDKLLGRDFGLGYDPVIGPDYPVHIDVTSARIREENGREWLYVTGSMLNERNGRTLIPTVTLVVYDLDGNLTMATAARPSANALAIGEAKPFTLKVPAWKDAARVEVRPGQLAPFLSDRDFCRPRAGINALQASIEYEVLQDDLRFNRAPNADRGPNSAPIRRQP